MSKTIFSSNSTLLKIQDYRRQRPKIKIRRLIRAVSSGSAVFASAFVVFCTLLVKSKADVYFTLNCVTTDLSHVLRKPAFCICTREADQRLCFCYIDSTYIRNFNPLAIFCGCTAQFVSNLVGNPEVLFSHNKAHLISQDC